MNAKFLCPAITVFDKEGHLDYEGNKQLWNNLINNKIDGIVIMGSTGEFFSMNLEEKKELIKLATDYIKGKTELLIGTGCENVKDTVELSNFAIDCGADGVMIVSPYYFCLTQEEIAEFYDKVANGVHGDIYLYNYPERTVHSIDAKTILKLVENHNNIVGLKDSVSAMTHTKDVIMTVKSQYPEFKVYCGLDGNLASNLFSGGDGVVGGVSNFLPSLCSDWISEFKKGNLDGILTIQKKFDIVTTIYETTKPFVPAIKTATKLFGIIENDYCRAPLIDSTDEQKHEIYAVFKRLGLLE